MKSYNAIDAELKVDVEKIRCYKFTYDGSMAIPGIIHLDSETEALQVPLIMLSFCVLVEQSQADAEVMKGVTWMQGACLENNLDFACRIKTGSGTGAITLPIVHFFKDFKRELMQHCIDTSQFSQRLQKSQWQKAQLPSQVSRRGSRLPRSLQSNLAVKLPTWHR